MSKSQLCFVVNSIPLGIQVAVDVGAAPDALCQVALEWGPELDYLCAVIEMATGLPPTRTVLPVAHIFSAGPFSRRRTFPRCPPHS